MSKCDKCIRRNLSDRMSKKDATAKANESAGIHTCPFKVEIWGDTSTKCNCCSGCRGECADDV